MNIKQTAELVHQLAKDKGWHDNDQGEDWFIERMCNNLHDEVSELHEAWRNGIHRAKCDKAEQMEDMNLPGLTCLEEELADIVIRVFDNAERLGIDIQRCIIIKHEFNRSRAFRHGGKKS